MREKVRFREGEGKYEGMMCGELWVGERRRGMWRCEKEAWKIKERQERSVKK